MPARLRGCLLILKISASLCLGGLVLAQTIQAQELPNRIRGYKVHPARIVVTNDSSKARPKEGSEAHVRIGEPELVDVNLTGITFELSGEVDSLEYSGRVDFLTFHDFRINGLAVDIEEYTESFEFRKNQLVSLPKPIRFFVNTRQALKGALNEVRGSKDAWTVTGRVFVFGRFKKLGFHFKRVVPVDIEVTVKNPLLTDPEK